MGQAKKIMMELEEKYPHSSLDNVSERLVGKALFGNDIIVDYFDKNGSLGNCSYSNIQDIVLPLNVLVRFIYDVIYIYYENIENAGLGWNSGFDRDNADDGYGQDAEHEFHMEQGGYILPPGKHCITDTYSFLMDNGFLCNNSDLLEDIMDGLGDINLVQKDPYGLTGDEERNVDWRIIKEKSIKMAKEGASLDDIITKEKARLTYMIDDIYIANYPLQIERDLTLYRAVPYESPITPPIPYGNVASAPPQYAACGRMNAKGVSMFYGATSAETGINEACTDPKKPYVYVGKFKSKHPLHLLDLTGIKANLSIFNQSETDYYILSFLSHFCHEISLPNNGDALEYVPTQLITHFFRNNLRHFISQTCSLPIDGILYSSAKDGSKNAVLFYDAVNCPQHLDLLECQFYQNGKNQGIVEIS